MSLKTKLLELFKYEPDKDGAQTFNIKSALNDNWDKIEAWAQSVKTALTKLVPTSRTVNGKTLAKDVTLTAADIKMPDSEEDVGAAMAKARCGVRRNCARKPAGMGLCTDRRRYIYADAKDC